MSNPSAEAAVKKLARLKGNITCPNCLTTNKLGFSTVCIKFHTFVCNACKSSHQAISHRCKSLTMSSWTHEEVMQLKRKGNNEAIATWLANAPPVGEGGRPKQGDSISIYKQFIVNAYENKKYYQSPSKESVLSLSSSSTLLNSANIVQHKKKSIKIDRNISLKKKIPVSSKTLPPNTTERVNTSNNVPITDLLSLDTNTGQNSKIDHVNGVQRDNENSYNDFFGTTSIPNNGHTHIEKNSNSTDVFDLFNNNGNLKNDMKVPEKKMANATMNINKSFDPFATTSSSATDSNGGVIHGINPMQHVKTSGPCTSIPQQQQIQQNIMMNLMQQQMRAMQMSNGFGNGNYQNQMNLPNNHANMQQQPSSTNMNSNTMFQQKSHYSMASSFQSSPAFSKNNVAYNNNSNRNNKNGQNGLNNSKINMLSNVNGSSHSRSLQNFDPFA